MQDAGYKARGRVFRDMNRESRRYPGLPFGYRDSVRVLGLRSWLPGTRYRIDAEGREPKTEPADRLAGVLAEFWTHASKNTTMRFAS
jgi:hypothetical protein